MNQQTMDSTIVQDISKSVDQLCAHLSVSNVTVPRIDKSKDVFEFISEYEMATATLSDEQRIKLLVKTFPPGRYKAWYEAELVPKIRSLSTWTSIKEAIIKRYADTEDRDRHFRRLQELKFIDNTGQKLFDYVEDLLFSLNKAFPNEKDEDTKIRYLKSNLPSKVKNTLCLNSDYNNAKTLSEFMRAIRQYDVVKSGCPETNQFNQAVVSELVTVLKDIAKDIKQSQESTCRNVVAALETRAPSRSPQRPYQSANMPADSQIHRRSDSPGREFYHNNRQRSISPWNSRPRGRSPSPARPSVGGQQYYSNYNDNAQYNEPYSSNNQQYYRNGSTDRSRYNQYHRSNALPFENRDYHHYNMQAARNYPPMNPPRPTGANGAIDLRNNNRRMGYPSCPCPNCGCGNNCQNHLKD